MTINHTLFLASNTLGDIAFRAANRSSHDANESLVAILFSAACFEATTNEVLYRLLNDDPSSLPERYRSIRLTAEAAGLGDRMARIERKLRVLGVAATGASFNADAEPWLNVLLLFRLRNWMVHLRPERLHVREGTDDEPSSLVSTTVHDLVSELLRARAIAEIPKGQLVPVMLAARLLGVGRWAYTTAYDGLKQVATWFPEWRGHTLILPRHPSTLDAV